jgi:hypothetical protein
VRTLRSTLVLACAAAALAWVACGQGIGDRCQVDEDCDGYGNGVVCNKATNTCQNTNGGSIDAEIPDAPHDGPADAPRDAPPDAMGSGSAI